MAVSPLLPGDPERLDGYLLAGRLGEGGQGVVYEGYDASGTRVAVKALYGRDGLRERFGKELAAATRVASFCTARVLAADLDGPTPYIVSEYVDGPSLRRFVAENGPLTGDGLHRLAVAVATALTAIHQAGVIHRDLKPDNVLLGPDGPRVIDFGIARTEEMTRTSTGMILGTPAYLAPEVLRGERGGQPADVFAWGVVLLFAATGHSPFEGPSLGAIVHRVLTVEPEIPHLSEPLRGLVAAALDKDPAARPTAAELLLRLLGTAGGDLGMLEQGAKAGGRLLVEHAGRPPLGAVAEGVYGRLDAVIQSEVPGLLLRMITPGESGTDALRVAQFAELAGSPEAERALDALEKGGLLKREESGVRLAHPALLHAWPRLREWVEAERPGLSIHRRLSEAAMTWWSHGFRRGDLYQGTLLEQTRDWAATGRRHIKLNEAETRFLAAASANVRRGVRLRRLALVTMSVLLAVALVAVAVAVGAARIADEQRREAQRQTTLSVSRRLATLSGLRRDDPALSAMLAVSAWRIAPTDEAHAALLSVVTNQDRGVFAATDDQVWAVAFSPDGTTLATGGGDGTARLWDVKTHRQIGRPFTHLGDSVTSVAFSPDGALLATVGGDRSRVRLWDVRTGERIGDDLPGPKVTSKAAFSPDGTMIAAGHVDGTVMLWDARSRRRIGVLAGHTDEVHAVAFSPDGRTLASSSFDHGVRLWDVRARRQIGEPLAGHTETVDGVAFSPDGKTLASGGADRTVRLWNVETHRPIGSVLTTDDTDWVTSVAFSPDGATVASGHVNNEIRFWDVTTRKPIGVPLVGHGFNPVRDIAYNPDGGLLASGHSGQVRLWGMRTHRQSGAPLVGDGKPAVLEAGFSPDGTLIATAGDDGKDRLWDVKTRRPVGDPVTESKEALTSVAFSPDGAVLATGGADQTIRFRDVASRRRIGDPISTSDVVHTVRFGPDGGTLMVALSNGGVELWDVRRRERIKEPAHDERWVGALSPDGTRLAVVGADATIRLWDVKTRREIGRLTGHTEHITAVEFSPDGNLLASSSDDNTVRLWDLAAFQETGTPFTTPDTDGVDAVVFSPDGSMLATVDGDDHLIRLWDVRARQQIGVPLTAHTDHVLWVAFSPDGRLLASASRDGTVRLWDVAVPPDLAAAACGIPARSLTRSEWTRYIPELDYLEICPPGTW